MDPLSLIVAALTAGAAAAAKHTAGAAIKDSYEVLKTLLLKKLAGHQAATVVLEEHAKDPYTFDAPLRKKLAEAAIDQDPEILQATQMLLGLAKPVPGATTAITQTISNVKYAATSGSGDATIESIHDHGATPDV
jgi:hypothetical protein